MAQLSYKRTGSSFIIHIRKYLDRKVLRISDRKARNVSTVTLCAGDSSSLRRNCYQQRSPAHVSANFAVHHQCAIKRNMSGTGAVPVAAKGLDVGGIYPPIATPFDKDENIDYHKLKANVLAWNKIPFRGYVVQGSNGEYAYLNQDERVDMVKRVRELAPREKLVIAGSGCESTRDTITMTARMAAAGADAVLVITPCYYKNGMTDEALFQHFSKVAEQSPVPVILYNVPANTGVDMSPDVIIRLSKQPNIIGLKDSAGDISKIGNLVYRTKSSGFQILAGSASFLYPALSIGCVGGVCALANMLGEDVCRLYQLHKDNNHADAKILQQRLIAPNSAVTRQFGVPGLKQAMDWLGLYGGPTRAPLLPLTVAQVDSLRRSFTDNGFL